MTCRQAEDQLTRALCEALPEHQRTALDFHLEVCAGCRARREALRAGTALLSQIQELRSPGGLAHLALQKLDTVPGTERPVRNIAWGRRLALAGLAAAVVAGAFTFQSPRRSATGPAQFGERREQVRQHSLAESRHGIGAPGSLSHQKARPRPGPGQVLPAVPGHSLGAANGNTAGGAMPTQLRARRSESTPTDDLPYLDGFDPSLTARWSGIDSDRSAIRRLLDRRLSQIEIKDDFVAIAYPQIAAAGASQTAVREAVRKYEREAQVVDARLFRKVKMRLKQAPLSDFCKALRQQTGVPFVASRTVTDENVTLLVKELPAREVMRAVARLFGYKWTRSGEEPDYRYELRQDLRSQIAEEELRSRQLNEALLALDEQLAGFRPYLDLGPEEIQKQLEKAEGADRFRLQALARWDWGPLQLYHRLTPAQRQALASGETLEFRTDARSPELRLPAEWRDFLLQRTGFVVGSVGGQQHIAAPHHFDTPKGPGTTSPIVGREGAELGIRLAFEGLQQGRPRLESFLRAFLLNADGTDAALSGSKGGVLGSAQSPAHERANNAALNRKLRNTPGFRQMVTIQPRVSCPGFSPENRSKDWHGLRNRIDGVHEPLYFDVYGSMHSGVEPPHLTSADVWEAIHDATGTPVVADGYSRLFDAEGLEAKNLSRFDALCRLGDRMRVRWQLDGGFLMGRSITYLWDKVAEVPARFLRQWRENRDKHGFLPLEDLLEASTLSDWQLESFPVGLAIGHCWGLEDWNIVGEGGALPIGVTGFRYSRPCARFVALLTDLQRSRSLQQGLAFEELLPAQQEALIQLLIKDGRPARDAVGVRLRVDYAPAGSYVWNPSVGSRAEADRLQSASFIWGKSAEETLAAARRAYPQAQARHVVRSHGILTLSFNNPTTGASWKAGWIGVQMNRD